MSEPTSSERGRAFAPPAAAILCALAGAAVFQFFGNATHGYIDTTSVFYWWGYQWFDARSESEHGLVILGIGAWLVWRNLRRSDRQSAISAQHSDRGQQVSTASLPVSAFSFQPSGFLAMAAGLGLNALGFAAQQTRLSILGVLVFAWGVVRLGGGARWGRAARFPLGFLIFAIPFNALDSLGFWLRLWVVKASAAIAHGIGIGVVRNGTQLLAADGRYQYDVAAACSGVRSLMALAALSLLLGYLDFRAWWRRGAMLLLCFPLVYVGNVARIVAIVLAAEWAGQRWGERVHDAAGFLVFAIVLGGVMAGGAALRRWWPEGKLVEPEHKPEGAADGRGSDGARAGRGPGGAKRIWLVVAGVVLLAAGEAYGLKKIGDGPGRGETGVILMQDGKNPVELPAILGRDWVGLPAAITPVEREILPADTGYARTNYVATRDRRQVFLSVVLSGRDRTSIHRPELCLLGQGWTIANETEGRFEYPGRGDAAFPATVLRVQHEVVTARGREALPQLVAYWFVGADAVVATHWQRLARDAWNRVAHARADRWAYVLIQTDATDGEEAALARMRAVLKEALPAFQRPMSGR